MATPSFEFDAFPKRLYRAADLMAGFDQERPASYADMLDTKIYREFVVHGGAATGDYLTAMSRALHDNGITQHLADALHGKKVVAIMGGHGVPRGSPAYVATARLAARLTVLGFLVASGGGPGAMEAVHLGAAFAQGGLEDALTAIASDASTITIPEEAQQLIRHDGRIDRDIAEKLGRFLAPAARLLAALPHHHGAGLGVPTWLYGQEPFTPFAGIIAKYFQNSIREDGLLALATHGIIYTPGSAGTLQEVFQDAAQNFYHTFPTGRSAAGYFSPMVFLGEDWRTSLPVEPLLTKLFESSPGVRNEFKALVTFTSDLDVAVAKIADFNPPHPSRPIAKVRATMRRSDDVEG